MNQEQQQALSEFDAIADAITRASLGFSADEETVLLAFNAAKSRVQALFSATACGREKTQQQRSDERFRSFTSRRIHHKPNPLKAAFPIEKLAMVDDAFHHATPKRVADHFFKVQAGRLIRRPLQRTQCRHRADCLSG